ncbi:MAG: TetR/AcrR family transcriptional regulator [Desulfatiglandales bacterium]
MSRKKNLERARYIEGVIAGLFARKGYKAVSMREIARTLDVRPSTLYHYFKSKEDVLFRIMETAMEESLRGLRSLRQSDLPPKNKLIQMLEYYASYYLEHSDRLTLLVNEISSLSPAMRGRLIEKEKEFVNLFRSLLERLCEEGEVLNIHPTSAIFSFFGMIHYTVKWYNPDGPISPESLSKEIVRIFTQGIFSSE